MTPRMTPLFGACPLLTYRPFYRPFEYSEFFEYFQKQNQALASDYTDGIGYTISFQALTGKRTS